MLRTCVLCIALLILFVPFSGFAEDGQSASVELPIRVSIIDFETTKKICGSANPPHWCPAHLRVLAGNVGDQEPEGFVVAGTGQDGIFGIDAVME